MSDFPVGKGSGAKSDFDVLIPPSSKDHFNGLTNKLPDADVNIGVSNNILFKSTMAYRSIDEGNRLKLWSEVSKYGRRCIIYTVDNFEFI